MSKLIRVICIITIVYVLFTTFFYREPCVQTIRMGNMDTVYFPSFGTVKKIEHLENPSRLYIAIFLSPLDIHYQYMPVRGTVRDIRHDDKGVYHLAFDMEKSRFNEKMVYTIDTAHGELLLYQIAGFLTRRISTDLVKSGTYETGEKVGLIKLGSRVDIIIPTTDRFCMSPQIHVGMSVTPDVVIGNYINN